MTGAAGMTGSELVARLIARGHEVRAVVRHAVSIPGAASVAIGDCADGTVVGPLIHDTDVLVHGAGILEGVRMARVPGIGDVKRIVIVSSAGVYSRHRASVSAYREGEAALAGVARSSVIVRPTMIYGSERDRNIHHVIAAAVRWGVLPLFGPGSALVQPIHFADLASALAEITDSATTGTIDAGGGDVLTGRDLLRTVFACLGRPARLIQLPLAPGIWAARVADRILGGRLAERLERLTEDRSVDNGRLLAITGVHPRRFADGVRDEISRLRAIGCIR